MEEYMINWPYQYIQRMYCKSYILPPINGFVCIIFSVVANTSNYKELPYAFAQTNAASLATLAANATGPAAEVNVK
jgi:hypothetical protein